MSPVNAPQDRSVESAPRELSEALVRVSYDMFIALKDGPEFYHHYMDAGSDLAHAKVIAKIIAANAAVESVMLVEYERIKKRIVWCSLIETSEFALAVGDTEQALQDDPVERTDQPD